MSSSMTCTDSGSCTSDGGCIWKNCCILCSWSSAKRCGIDFSKNDRGDNVVVVPKLSAVAAVVSDNCSPSLVLVVALATGTDEVVIGTRGTAVGLSKCGAPTSIRLLVPPAGGGEGTETIDD